MSWAQDTKLRLQFFCLFSMFTCPGFLIWMAPGISRQLQSNSWPAVEGQVQGVIAKSQWDQKKRTSLYFGRVIYRYTVDGQEYSTDLTDLGPGLKHSDQQSALADVSGYDQGMTMPVYYDPQNPATGILVRGIPTIHVVLIVALMVGTVVCSVVSFFTVRGWLRGLRRTPSVDG